MKSRTSFFNFTVLRKNISRFFPLWGLLTVFKVLYLMLTAGDPNYFAGTVADGLVSNGFMQFYYGGLCALLLFGGLFDTRTAYTIHALPLRREGWFLTHLCSGICLYLLPNGVEALLSMLLLGSFWYLALLQLVIGFVLFLLFFAIGAFSCQCSGTRLGALAVYMLTNFFSMLVFFLVETFYIPLLRGIAINTQLAMHLCPAVAITNGQFVLLESRYVNSGYNSGHWEAEFQGFVGNDWLQLLFAGLIALAILAVALLLYRRRQIERAGNFIAVRFMVPVFLVLYSLSCGAGLYLISDRSYLFMIAGIAIGFFTGLMLLQKKVNVFHKHAWLTLGILILVFLGSLGITKLDLFGSVSYVPDPDQVKYATISENVYSYTSLTSSMDFEESVRLDTPEELQALEKVHHTLLEETEESIKQTMITYRLKDGRTIHRVYSYDSASESSKQLRPLLSRLDLFEDPQILNRVVSITYENDLGDLLSDVQILSRPLTNEAFDPAVTFKHASQDLLTLDPVATGLWDAVWKDCLEGNMAQNWEYHSQSRGWLYVVYLNEDGEKKVAQFSIFKEATHTIAYLKALNP